MALTIPPGFQSVGIRNGSKQATNRGQDQSFVFAMLKAIPEAQGGAAQQLAGEGVPILGNGTCSTFLADLIKRFQRSAGGSTDGVVDPGGNTLRLLMQRSGAHGAMPAAATKPGAPLQRLSHVPYEALPPMRKRILQQCALVLAPAGGCARRPSAEELRAFFVKAQAEHVPTVQMADRSLKTLNDGCYVIGNEARQWCGIFACAVVVTAGLPLYWRLVGGVIRGAPEIMGWQGLMPGDIAKVPANSHHFLVTDITPDGGVVTLEGNAGRQMIKPGLRTPEAISSYYRTVPH